MTSKMVRVSDDEAARMLKVLAGADVRGEGAEVAWLIRQEWGRRFSAASPAVTVEEAERAIEEVRAAE